MFLESSHRYIIFPIANFLSIPFGILVGLQLFFSPTYYPIKYLPCIFVTDDASVTNPSLSPIIVFSLRATGGALLSYSLFHIILVKSRSIVLHASLGRLVMVIHSMMLLLHVITLSDSDSQSQFNRSVLVSAATIHFCFIILYSLAFYEYNCKIKQSRIDSTSHITHIQDRLCALMISILWGIPKLLIYSNPDKMIGPEGFFPMFYRTNQVDSRFDNQELMALRIMSSSFLPMLLYYHTSKKEPTFVTKLICCNMFFFFHVYIIEIASTDSWANKTNCSIDLFIYVLIMLYVFHTSQAFRLESESEKENESAKVD